MRLARSTSRSRHLAAAVTAVVALTALGAPVEATATAAAGD
ncbi:hypothetical protein ABZO31_33450 [Streptomyces sp. HUAS MG47]